MKRANVIELQSYTYKELKELLQVSEEELNEIKKELCFKNIIRLEKIKNEEVVKFKFVGMIYILNKYIIYCYPKYIDSIDNMKVMKNILKVIKKYSYESEKLLKDNINLEGIAVKNFELSKIHNMMFLIDDYLNYGLYNNQVDTLEINGQGEVDWNSTINNTNPILTDRGPIYCDLYTNSTVDDFSYIITQIHKYAISESSKFLNKIGFCEIFGYPVIDFNISVNQIGGIDNIKHYINQELNIQFYDRNINVLKSIKNILLDLNQSMAINSTIVYGSRSFYTIWEKVCGFVLKNEYEKIKDSIEKPKWKDYKTKKETEKDTLNPDIIRDIKEDKKFFIFDAKYYKKFFDVNGDIKETCPGIYDITKQYLYHKILEDKIGNNYKVYNIFLFPGNDELELSVNDKLELFGSVSLDFFKKLKLEDIYLIRMNANNIFDMYIKGETYEKDIFDDISNMIEEEQEKDIGKKKKNKKRKRKIIKKIIRKRTKI